MPGVSQTYWWGGSGCDPIHTYLGVSSVDEWDLSLVGCLFLLRNLRVKIWMQFFLKMGELNGTLEGENSPVLPIFSRRSRKTFSLKLGL